jgi:hypothetical protein
VERAGFAIGAYHQCVEDWVFVLFKSCTHFYNQDKLIRMVWDLRNFYDGLLVIPAITVRNAWISLQIVRTLITSNKKRHLWHH